MKLVIFFLIFAVTVGAQTPKRAFVYITKSQATICKTAGLHQHDDVVTVTMRVVSWDGCELRGMIRRGDHFKGKGHGGRFNGQLYTVFGGFENNTKLKPRQKIKVTYDRSCGQVLFASFPENPGIQ